METKQLNDRLPGIPAGERYWQTAWRAQRITMWAVAVLLILSLLGVFGGDGPLNSARTVSTSGVELFYSRFIHELDPNDLEIRVPARFASNGTLRVWIDMNYLRHLEFQDINPTPVQVISAPNRMIYEFQVDPDVQQIVIMLGVTPTRIGLLSASLGVEGGEPLEFDQLVYP